MSHTPYTSVPREGEKVATVNGQDTLDDGALPCRATLGSCRAAAAVAAAAAAVAAADSRRNELAHRKQRTGTHPTIHKREHDLEYQLENGSTGHQPGLGGTRQRYPEDKDMFLVRVG